MSSQPLVSVIMPVYNSERYLREAIESILNQTFKDFELLLITGSSTDGTDIILERFQEKDRRIKIIYEEQEGLVAALNMGCILAKGQYIARMDTDDRCLPQRLERQVKYMKSHPEIGILGTWARYIDESGQQVDSARTLTNPKLIGFHLYFANCIIHSSVIMRREILENLGSYSLEALHAEDYELWSRAMGITMISVLPEILLESRIWSGSVSNLKSEVQKQTVVRIRRVMISELLGSEASADLIVSPPKTTNHSALEIAGQVYSISIIIGQLSLAYRKANSLNFIESLQAAHISLIFFKKILKEIF
jgi:glycosyltransferase involved in cell wall biosynthesis